MKRRRLPQRGDFLLGAAIATGMTAKAAERGGADFLLALSAGRFRNMGVPSAACMLALRDSNQLVMEFGVAEILTRTSLPVFFGAAAFGVDDFEPLLNRVTECGFYGVTNFPSCVFLDGQYRRFLEQSAQGFDRELALLEAARQHGLSTLAYVHTLEEAARAAKAHVDIINLDFGWNHGGLVGVESTFGLPEAKSLATEFVAIVSRTNPRTRCLIEGGPIVTPEHMDEVCRAASADGYIGGSTIDRVPLESAIEMATGAFKTIGTLRKQVDSLERKLSRKLSVDALVGFSESIDRAREQVGRAMETDLPVLILGEPGTGRHEIAKIIHESRVRRGRWLICAQCTDQNANDVELNLFGCVASPFPGVDKPRTGLLELARGSSLVIDDVGSLPVSVQRQLLQAARAGGFLPKGGTEVIDLDSRIIGITRFDAAAFSDAHRIDTHFSHWLGSLRIDLPPLRTRLEDLPMLAEAVLRAVCRTQKKKLAPEAYRALLTHDWPGNLAELRAVLQAAVLESRGTLISGEILARVLRSRQSAPSDRAAFSSEREWILDGLRRNRFRRADTAQFLRISRKTLYNKLRQYGLSELDWNASAAPSARYGPLRSM